MCLEIRDGQHTWQSVFVLWLSVSSLGWCLGVPTGHSKRVLQAKLRQDGIEGFWVWKGWLASGMNIYVCVSFFGS